jgi:hypothetical protein
VSGDAIQFDPGRKKEPYPWDQVLVESCFLWTGPLDADYAGFRKGERPGENAFDSKVDPDAPRATIAIRHTLMKGWGHGQIGNGAALNLKERIQAIIEKCVFVENDIAFRCRGALGSAWVTARDNTVYRTTRVFRPEHNVENVVTAQVGIPGRDAYLSSYGDSRRRAAWEFRVCRGCGAGIHTVAQLPGHKDLRKAARYQRLSPTFLVEAAPVTT